jgi:hypothetical protein
MPNISLALLGRSEIGGFIKKKKLPKKHIETFSLKDI